MKINDTSPEIIPFQNFEICVIDYIVCDFLFNQNTKIDMISA